MREYIVKFVSSTESMERLSEGYDPKRSKVVRVYDNPSYDVIREHARIAKSKGFDSFGIHLNEADMSTRAVIRTTLSDIYDDVTFYPLRESDNMGNASQANTTNPGLDKFANRNTYIVTPYAVLQFTQDGQLSHDILEFYGRVWKKIENKPNVKIRFISHSSLLFGRDVGDYSILGRLLSVNLDFLSQNGLAGDNPVYKVLSRVGDGNDAISDANASTLKTLSFNNHIICAGDAFKKITQSGGRDSDKQLVDNLDGNNEEERRTLEKLRINTDPAIKYIVNINRELNDAIDANNITAAENAPSRVEKYVYEVMKAIESDEEIRSVTSISDFSKILIDHNKSVARHRDPNYKSNLLTKNDTSTYWDNTELGQMLKKNANEAAANNKEAQEAWDALGEVFNRKNKEGKGAIDASVERFYNRGHMVKDIMGLEDDDPRFDYRVYDNPDIREKGVSSIAKHEFQVEIIKNENEITKLQKSLALLDPHSEDDRKEIILIGNKIDDLNDVNRNLRTELSTSARDEVMNAKLNAVQDDSTTTEENVKPSAFEELGEDKGRGTMCGTSAYKDFVRSWLCNGNGGV